jgi:hypothetical protein
MAQEVSEYGPKRFGPQDPGRFHQCGPLQESLACHGSAPCIKKRSTIIGSWSYAIAQGPRRAGTAFSGGRTDRSPADGNRQPERIAALAIGRRSRGCWAISTGRRRGDASLPEFLTSGTLRSAREALAAGWRTGVRSTGAKTKQTRAAALNQWFRNSQSESSCPSRYATELPAPEGPVGHVPGGGVGVVGRWSAAATATSLA